MSAEEVIRSVFATLAHTPPETIYARLGWAEARIVQEADRERTNATRDVRIVEAQRDELAKRLAETEADIEAKDEAMRELEDQLAAATDPGELKRDRGPA